MVCGGGMEGMEGNVRLQPAWGKRFALYPTGCRFSDTGIVIRRAGCNGNHFLKRIYVVLTHCRLHSRPPLLS